MRTKFMIFSVLCLCLLAITSGSSATPGSNTLTWEFQNDYQYTIDLKFFERSRNLVWPGRNQVYVLNDRAVRSITLSCNSGDYICYGGSESGNPKIYWGVGIDGKQGCDRCCYYCGSQTRTKRLY
jgi:hypothetical protein